MLPANARATTGSRASTLVPRSFLIVGLIAAIHRLLAHPDS
jgi:hypothetical protein